MEQERQRLARLIDHTALKPETTEQDVRQLCEEARRYGFASVFVNPCYVSLCAGLLRDSTVTVGTVIGFPLGASATAIKVREAEQAVQDGATELDMVLNVGWLKSGRHGKVEADIRAVVEYAHQVQSSAGKRILVKVILETELLTDDEKILACTLAQQAGADYVKTSTGFSTGGATAADVALMRRVVGNRMGVKASGGIRTSEQARQLVDAGANRIGASASVAIIQGIPGTDVY